MRPRRAQRAQDGEAAEPTITRDLTPDRTTCPHRGGPLRADYAKRQTVHTLAVSERAVTNLLDRYDELLAIALADDRRLKKMLATRGKVVLAPDGLQPDVGHEVLWVLRDVLSGEILLAKSQLSARRRDPAELLSVVKASCLVPIITVVSSGERAGGRGLPSSGLPRVGLT